MAYLTINNKSIRYEYINQIYSADTNTVLVFLHEGLGSVEQWKDFPDDLSKKLKIPAFIYDRYGYGQSTALTEKRENNYLETEATSWLAKILKQLFPENRKIILIGHSDGGTIALLYASFFPANVKAVITEAAHVFVEEFTYQGLRPVYDKFYKQGLKNKLEKHHGDRTISMFHGWYDVWTNPEFRQWNIEKYLSNIQCKVLAIQGKDDEYGTIRQLNSIKKNIQTECKTVHIDDCGHTPHFQAREICEEKMINFINSLQL